ncbi:hypothetical protein BC936DRAFT_143996, partial [Jimgerdemannia flammicorona]
LDPPQPLPLPSSSSSTSPLHHAWQHDRHPELPPPIPGELRLFLQPRHLSSRACESLPPRHGPKPADGRRLSALPPASLCPLRRARRPRPVRPPRPPHHHAARSRLANPRWGDTVVFRWHCPLFCWEDHKCDRGRDDVGRRVFV